MAKPYTIRLFVPDGDPNTFKIIDKMNWTGIGLEISRTTWKQYRNRKEMEQAGVYILFGYQDDNDLPTLYIGQGDGVKSRIDSHEKNKEFWDKVLVFVSSNGGLNRAHITWLEWALITRARDINRSRIDNNTVPVFGIFKPEPTIALNKAAIFVSPSPKTSPVDFISGPRLVSTNLNLSNENTGAFTV